MTQLHPPTRAPAAEAPSDVELTGRPQRSTAAAAPAATALPASLAWYRIVTWATAIIDAILAVAAIGASHGWDQQAMSFFYAVGSWFAAPFQAITQAYGEPAELAPLLAIFVYTVMGCALAKMFRLNVALAGGLRWAPGLRW